MRAPFPSTKTVSTLAPPCYFYHPGPQRAYSCKMTFLLLVPIMNLNILKLSFIAHRDLSQNEIFELPEFIFAGLKSLRTL